MFQAILSLDWGSITEGVVSGGIVAVIFGFFLKWLLERYKRPKLSMIINLEEPLRGNRHWLTIQIRNDGRSAFREKEVSWHLYWPDSFPVHHVAVDDRRIPIKDNGGRPYQILGASRIDGEVYWHLSGSNKVVLHPQMEIEIIIFKLENPYADYKDKPRYHFSTTLGLEPEKVFTWKGFQKIKDANGFPKLNLLPHIKVRDIRESSYKNELFVPSIQPPNNKF